MPAVSLEVMRKSWPGVLAVDDVSLSVEAGEIHAIVGENGAGKTTLMRLLGGLTALQLRVLKFIAGNGTENLYSLESQQTIGASASSIRRSVTALTDKWILVKDPEKIYFNNPFLRQFLIMRKI